MIKKLLKKQIQKFLGRHGYEIVFSNKNYGRNPFQDMIKFINKKNPMVFDVGANVGQTVKEFLHYFPGGTINSFEPSLSTFKLLKQNVSNNSGVNIWNYGLGSTNGEVSFFENSNSDMSSFLKLGEIGWGTEKKSLAKITTVDEFCSKHKINTIDILKIDTQGFELEVLKGAKNIFSNNQIKMVYCEVIFSKMYKKLPSFGDLEKFLVERGFSLVSIYKVQHQNNLAGWTDVLFVHESSLNKLL